MIADWWNALSFELQMFYGIALLASGLVVVQLLLAILGFDSDGLDGAIDFDTGDFDHGSGIGIFSTQTLAAFFLGFGWSGVAAVQAGLSTLPAVLVAFIVGVVSMSAMFFMLRGLLRLQAKGNLNYESAIGKEGTVYVTIPGSDKDGGQIQVTFQGRFTTASARKVSPGEMKPGERVRVTGTYGGTSFLVEPLHSGTPGS
ncbi:MAG: NfeD family protein [Verrucomicrobiales bacterium]|nr:NfeD family protein [Verrucomicrobiota bacterium JB025]